MQGIDVELWQCSGAWGEKLPAAFGALGYQLTAHPPVSPGQDLTLHDFTKHLEAFLQLAGAHAAGEVSDVHHPAFPLPKQPEAFRLAPCTSVLLMGCGGAPVRQHWKHCHGHSLTPPGSAVSAPARSQCHPQAATTRLEQPPSLSPPLKFSCVLAALSASPGKRGIYSQELPGAKSNYIAGKSAKAARVSVSECAQQQGAPIYSHVPTPLPAPSRCPWAPAARGCSGATSVPAEQLQGFPSSPHKVPVPSALRHQRRMLWAPPCQGLRVLPKAGGFHWVFLSSPPHVLV